VTEDPAQPLLEVRDLAVGFRRDGTGPVVRAVDDVSFTLHAGETLGLVGESGCGKSVTALSLLRLLPSPPSVREARALALDWLRKVGLPDAEQKMEDLPHQLSGGMRQRVMIAMALACEPKLLIADEPTTALDVTIQAQILELIMELKEKLGMAVILITHDLGIVSSMCDRIAVMYAGKVIECGTTDDIFYRPQHEYTKGLLRSVPRIDEKETQRLVAIEGTPVDMLNPPAGCPFAPRCPKCMKICLREMPPYTTFSDLHYAACWLRQKEALERGETF
jgi:oligopeptide transport system ATP-binding protein